MSAVSAAKPATGAGAGPAIPSVPAGDKRDGGKDADQLKQCNEAVEGLLLSLEGLLVQSKNMSSSADSSSQVSMQYHVEKMTHSSETLLQMISNLKVSAVFNDMAAMNARVDARTKELRDAEVHRQQSLVTLGLEVSDLLHELETHYYSTQ